MNKKQNEVNKDKNQVIIIGITGAFGSGKTTVAQKLQEHYGTKRCVIISLNTNVNNSSSFPEEKRY